MEQKALVSPIKSVVAVVKNLDESRQIFEDGLGLQCVGETRNENFYSLKNVRAARFAREGEDFGCVDLIENKNADAPVRDSSRPFDYGILTLNFRTNNLEKAVEKLEEFGATKVSEPQSYNVGKPMREVMMNLASGERLTIIQIGEAENDEPFFREAIATSGVVVPSMAEAKSFYQDALGLTLSISFQAAGAPFDALIGVSALDRLDFATFTSDGNWTGKVELLELDVPNETAKEMRADGTRAGYWMNSFLTADWDAALEKIRRSKAEIIGEPAKIERPFEGFVRACLVKGSGGELIEILDKG